MATGIGMADVASKRMSLFHRRQGSKTEGGKEGLRRWEGRAGENKEASQQQRAATD
jgi:hypothetical protein